MYFETFQLGISFSPNADLVRPSLSVVFFFHFEVYFISQCVMGLDHSMNDCTFLVQDYVVPNMLLFVLGKALH